MVRPTIAKIFRIVAGVAADKRGTSIVFSALALTAITGFVGLGIDVSYWLTEQRNLQGVADQAVFSAAVAASSDPTTGDANARAVAAQLGYVAGQRSITLAVNT